MVGDEGSGFAVARAGLTAALRGHDGRGPATSLLATFLRELGLAGPSDIPPWVGRAAKSEIAALAVHVVRAAGEGDEVAALLVRREADGLAQHAGALLDRLGPWSSPPPVVLHGGLTRAETFAAEVRQALSALRIPLQVRPAAADAVSGAVQLALLEVG